MSNTTKKAINMPVKVGDEIIVKPTYELYRIYGKEPRKAIVKKVGKKYFYADIEGTVGDHNGLSRFDREMYGSSPYYLTGWRGYLSLKDIEDENEKNLLLQDIRKFFEHPNNIEKLTLDQVRQIKSIIGDIE